ncbi:hypothetical protein PLO_0584 [Pediococcus acidilactici NGRI 0510Q]|nr:hypothetical protein PLO_0584 [Pediococcus acidilactici NGRI 0510Q]
MVPNCLFAKVDFIIDKSSLIEDLADEYRLTKNPEVISVRG